jgi:hypothetical protein
VPTNGSYCWSGSAEPKPADGYSRATTDNTPPITQCYKDGFFASNVIAVSMPNPNDFVFPDVQSNAYSNVAIPINTPDALAQSQHEISKNGHPSVSAAGQYTGSKQLSIPAAGTYNLTLRYWNKSTSAATTTVKIDLRSWTNPTLAGQLLTVNDVAGGSTNLTLPMGPSAGPVNSWLEKSFPFTATAAKDVYARIAYLSGPAAAFDVVYLTM